MGGFVFVFSSFLFILFFIPICYREWTFFCLFWFGFYRPASVRNQKSGGGVAGGGGGGA